MADASAEVGPSTVARLRWVSRITAAVSRGASQEVHALALEAICRGLGAECAGLLLVERDVLEVSSASAPELQALGSALIEFCPWPDTATPTQPLVLRTHSGAAPLLAQLQLLGFREVAFVPIVDEALIGRFVVCCTDVCAPVAEDLALAFTLGQQVALDRRRHLTEAGLRASQDQLRALAIRLQDVREQERAAIAREIHDELGQELTALKLDIAWTRNRLRRSDPAESAGIDARLLDMSSLADRSIATVQRIASGLRPRVLDDLGLAAAVEWQAQQFQERTGIRCRLGAHIDDEQIPMPAATAAFRIFQEALTNVARHAEASRVKVQIGRVRGDLVLEVSDNGRGIRPEAVSSTTSIGLLGMRERAVALGGEVLVEGFPGRGSSVLLRLPLEPRQREES